MASSSKSSYINIQRKGQKPYSFTYIWNIKQKTNMNKHNTTRNHRYRRQNGGDQRGNTWREGKMG